MRLTENTKIRIKVPKSLYEAIQAELDINQNGMGEDVSAEELKKCYKYYLNGFFDKAKKIQDGGTDPDSSIEQAMFDLGMNPMMEIKDKK
jgi:hypothetical protein